MDVPVRIKPRIVRSYPPFRKAWIRLFNDADIFYHYSRWPLKLRHLLFRRKHPNNNERFALTMFFLINGLRPSLILAFFKDMWDAPNSDLKSIRWNIKVAPTKDWTAWSIAEQRSISTKGHTFPEHKRYWDLERPRYYRDPIVLYYLKNKH